MSSTTMNSNSNYIVSTQSIISGYDRKILTRLYQPLIGSISFSLYLTLLSELEFDKTVSSQYHTVESLYKLMNVSFEEIVLAKTKLEGCGLIKTFFNKKLGIFVFSLFSPLSPNDFFDNPLLDSLFLKSLGQEEYDRNKQYFTFANIPETDLEDVSSNFDDAYSNDSVSSKSNSRQVKKKTLGIKIEFDFDVFYAKLSELQVSKKAIPLDVLNRIPYFSYAYNISAVEMADIIVRSQIKTGTSSLKEVRELCVRYARDNSNISQINKSKNTGSTLLDQIVALYDTNEPIEFVTIKFDLPVPKFEEEFIYDMMVNYKLQAPIMNAVLDYMFEKSNNSFNKNFLETLCASVARKSPKSSLDAYNILRSSPNKQVVEKEENKEEDFDDLIKKNLELIEKRKKAMNDGEN